MRILLDGTAVVDHGELHELSVSTKCPGKYALVDTETGEVFMAKQGEQETPWHYNYEFKPADDHELERVAYCIEAARHGREEDE